MKNLTLLGLLLSLPFLVSLAPIRPLYQVITSHPHDLAKLSSFVETVKQDGRLWLVHLKEDAPHSVQRYLRNVDLVRVQSYVPQISQKDISNYNVEIKKFTQNIDIARIRKDVETLSAVKNRSAGSEENKKIEEFLESELKALNYQVSKVCYKANVCSIVADKIGQETDEVIMLMAHFDSVGRDFAGADDNASGTAVLLDVARALQTYNNKKTIRFFATNGEEGGLLGAKHYANLLASNGEIKKMKLAINMDMVGYNSNGILELETDSQYEDLANWFALLASKYTTLKTKITIGAWGSDHVPFIQKGVPTLLTIEDWSTKTPCYHMACDKPDTLNYQYAGEIAKLNLAAIMEKDL